MLIYFLLLWIFSSEIYEYRKLTYEDIHYFYTLYLQLQRQILNKGTNSQTVKAILEAR